MREILSETKHTALHIIGTRTQIIAELVAIEVQEVFLRICTLSGRVSWRNFTIGTRYALRYHLSPLLVSFPPASSILLLGQGYTNPGRLNSLQWPLILVKSSVWNLLHVTLPAPGILMWRIEFRKMCSPLSIVRKKY